jgi:hypothetical protein
MTRSVDSEKLQAIWGDLTPEQQGAFKWKPEVTLTGLKKVPTEQMTKLAEVITTKPSKPSFELKD